VARRQLRQWSDIDVFCGAGLCMPCRTWRAEADKLDHHLVLVDYNLNINFISFLFALFVALFEARGVVVVVVVVIDVYCRGGGRGEDRSVKVA
jgi:hypothetical protein